MMIEIEIVDELQLLPQAPQVFLDRLTTMAEELKLEGSVVIKVGDQEESRDLNARYRKKDYPTDVLSFPFQEELPEGGFYLGDIFICYPIAKEQAAENNIPVEEEVFSLMVHGILHLGGFDHEEDDGEMLGLQEQLIEKYWQPVQAGESMG